MSDVETNKDLQQTSKAERQTRTGADGSLIRHRIRDKIETMILSRQLLPGQRLTQLDLAKKFDVAQSVIRETLIELQMTGLVRSIDNRGMYVAELDATRLIQSYQIREVFEGLAARLCSQIATRAEIREMYALADKSYEAGRDGQPDQRSETDRQFHLRIIVASRNELLAQLTEGYRALGMVVRTDRPVDTVYSEHRAIVRAIEEGKGEKAERLAREHAAAAREIIEKQVASGHFVPNWVMPKEE